MIQREKKKGNARVDNFAIRLNKDLINSTDRSKFERIRLESRIQCR